MKAEDFYPKQEDYWERAHANLAGWLGPQCGEIVIELGVVAWVLTLGYGPSRRLS